MKKFIPLFIIVTVVFTGQWLYSKQNASITLTKKVGDVQAQKGDSWEPAQPDSSLIKGDRIKTGVDSYAELALNPENRFRVKESTEVEMNRIMEDTTDPIDGVVQLVQFDLKSGSMLAKLDKLPTGVKLSVGSPTAVAGATGTEFAVVVDPEGQTHVACLESNVSVISTSNPKQTVVVAPFQKVDIAPWDVVTLQAKGTGLPSKAILGENFVQEAEDFIMLVGTGSGPTPDEAMAAARRNLSDRVFDIAIGPEKKLGDLMEEDFELSQRIFESLYNARVVQQESLPNGLFEVELEISLTALSEAAGISLKSVQQSIRPISLAEYGRKFGPLARVTTRRAAQVDALRKLAEKIYGSVIDSQTTIKDFEATNDQVTTVVQGVVQGSEIVQETYFSDGSVSVTMQAPGRNIKGALTPVIGNVLGNNYMSSPTRIIVDDFQTYKELENI